MKLGCIARDVVTGFKGVIIGQCIYLTGCNQWGIHPGIGKDGKLGEPAWFDETRIEFISEGPELKTKNIKKTGGPQNSPSHTTGLKG